MTSRKLSSLSDSEFPLHYLQTTAMSGAWILCDRFTSSLNFGHSHTIALEETAVKEAAYPSCSL